MPIDADQFLARIKGDRPVSADRPSDQYEVMSATSDIAPSDNQLNSGGVLGAKLETVTAKSLIKADEILDLPLDPERRHYQAELRAPASIINTTLNTQARVGEAALHKEVVDRLPELIKLIQEEERRLYGKEAGMAAKATDRIKLDPEEELHLHKLVQQMRVRNQDDG
jgi:hypothetical protein